MVIFLGGRHKTTFRLLLPVPYDTTMSSLALHAVMIHAWQSSARDPKQERRGSWFSRAQPASPAPAGIHIDAAHGVGAPKMEALAKVFHSVGVFLWWYARTYGRAAVNTGNASVENAVVRPRQSVNL